MVNILPSLILGVVPLIAYMIVPRTYAFASTVRCVFSLVHVGAGYVDYLNIVHLLRLPADSKIQISGAKIYPPGLRVRTFPLIVTSSLFAVGLPQHSSLQHFTLRIVSVLL